MYKLLKNWAGFIGLVTIKCLILTFVEIFQLKKVKHLQFIDVSDRFFMFLACFDELIC